MKATELRIGNFVDIVNRHNTIHMPYGLVKQVGPIEFFKVHLYEAGNFATQGTHEVVDIKDLSPIPLTEEWLLKFGFEKDYDDCPTLENPASNRFQWSMDGMLWQQYPGNDWSSFKCEYIHQLQNLYFALTGEELTIKEK